MRDFVLPDNNEAEFIELASKLGVKKLYFLYEFDSYIQQKTEKKLKSMEFRDIRVETCFIVSHKNINIALKHSKLLVAESSDDNRFFIEGKKIKLIYGFEETNRKDYMHQRASGLNHIICELAGKNNVAIGFSYNSLFNKNAQIASSLIGRMMQNIFLCQKYKVKTSIGSFSSRPFEMRNSHDLASLFTTLGMDKKKIKESLANDL